VKREGACPCRAVRYSIDGPVRDVLVCHCAACCETAGGPWPASAARRRDLVVDDETALTWERAAVSEHGASRGRCQVCGTTVFWDAPGRETVSFAVATLADASGLEIAGHIWVAEGEERSLPAAGAPRYSRGLPASAVVPWRA
jgi:hypothetical protein